MGSYSFKAAGKTQQQIEEAKLTSSPTPIGIKTPLQMGTDEGIFAMHYELIDQVHDNLRNLLLTNWGERLGLYDFGANLRPICTELVSQDDFDSNAINRISNAVAKWMPYISLEDFVSQIDHLENKNTGVIRLTVTYVVPTLSPTKRALQVVLYTI